MSGPRIVPSDISGFELAARVSAAAGARGIAPAKFVRESGLSDMGAAWLSQIRNSRTPHARTIDRVNRAIAGEILGRVTNREPQKKPWTRVVKTTADDMMTPERLAAMRASSEARAVLARVGIGGDRRDKGREILIPGDVWAAVKAEAEAGKQTPAETLLLAIKAGLDCLGEDRAEAERIKLGSVAA